MSKRTCTVRCDDLADVLDRVLHLPLVEHPHPDTTARLHRALTQGDPSYANTLTPERGFLAEGSPTPEAI